MNQYQSFPDAAGASHTLEKLKALMLPDLAGRSFLDVGCNEGFFCGFAEFQGAARVLGIDYSAGFVERARQRFPGCEFRCQGWDALPDERFDVILLASALHYAEDQPALLRSLVERLASDGVLVVELGIASSQKSEWVRTRRGIDERDFPSMAKLREVLADYAWKWMGRSVSQDGDPVARHVVHISRRRPVAYLLMQPPGYGKSSIATRLFVPAGIPVVSGDQQLSLIAKGKSVVSEELQQMVGEGYSPFRLDQIMQRVFDAGEGAALVDAWIDAAGSSDFAIDAYVPQERHAMVRQHLLARGYLPVLLDWERIGAHPAPSDLVDAQAEAFYLSMAQDEIVVPASRPPLQAMQGFVDEVRVNEGRLLIRGWVVDAEGTLPSRLGVRLGGRTIMVDAFDRQLRPDVQRHLRLPHGLVGYRMALDVPGIARLQDLARSFEVFVPGGGSIPLAGPLAQQLAAARSGRQ